MSDAGEQAPRAVAIIPESQRSTNERYRFSAAIRSGEVLRCSGQIGNGADGSLATDPAAQFEQAFANVAEVLAEAGGSWADVVEMTTFHVGLAEHLATFAGVRAKSVPERTRHGRPSAWPSWPRRRAGGGEGRRRAVIGVAEVALGVADRLLDDVQPLRHQLVRHHDRRGDPQDVAGRGPGEPSAGTHPW